jgi:IS5 family transposase
VEVPIRRDSKEGNEAIKEGKVLDSIADNPNIACQKDLEARWTKKHGKSYFGYKNHIPVDVGSKLIREWEVTQAHDHDSQVFEDVLKDVRRGHPVFADNAYADEKKEERLEKKRAFYYLTSQRGAHWKWWNSMVARTRSRVEHVFGWMTKTMGGKSQRANGLRRKKQGSG